MSIDAYVRSSFFTSPRLRGEVDARSASGEGASQGAEPVESPPRPARTFGSRHPLPASGERERRGCAYPAKCPKKRRPGFSDSGGIWNKEPHLSSYRGI